LYFTFLPTLYQPHTPLFTILIIFFCSTMTSQTKQFGIFAMVAPEVRVVIWHSVLDTTDARSNEGVGPGEGNRTAIFRVSRAIFEEASYDFYKNANPLLTVQPEGFRSQSAFGVRQTQHKWFNAPWTRFQSITIQVDPPSNIGCGVLLDIRYALADLLCVLLGFRKGQESLEDRGMPSWECQQLLDEFIQDPSSTKLTASPLIKVEFTCTASSSRFGGPAPYTVIDSDILLWKVVGLTRYLKRRYPVALYYVVNRRGTNPTTRKALRLDPSRADATESDVVKQEAHITLTLDSLMNRSTGLSAAVLRRERLEDWHSYERGLERLYEVVHGRRTAALMELHNISRLYRILHPGALDERMYVMNNSIWRQAWREKFPKGIPREWS